MSPSEEPNTASPHTGSLPPPPPQVKTVPLLADPGECVWYNVRFGANGFDFLPQGLLGISSENIVLAGKRLHQHWLSFIYFPPTILYTVCFATFLVYVALDMIFDSYNLNQQMLFVYAFLLSVAGVVSALYFLQSVITRQSSLTIHCAQLSDVGHHGRWLTFRALNESGDLRYCSFILHTPQEAESIAAELALVKRETML